MVDIVGMGASDRPEDYDCTSITAEETVDYFNDYFERWRKAMGGITQFYLTGHSFGGYLCGLYTSRYPQHVKQLVMISPIGVKPLPEGFDQD